MSQIDSSEISRVLDSLKDLEKISDLTGLSISGARKILERLLEEPELQKAAQEFMESPDRSVEYKAHRSGHAEGRVQGHSEGFAKGIGVTIFSVAGLAIAGAAILLYKRDT